MGEPGEDGQGGTDLAAEYVLGVLDAAQRLEAQRRIARDPAFAAEVAHWEERLSPLSVEYGEVPAPVHVRGAIDARLFGTETPARRTGQAFWRNLAIASLAGLALSIGMQLRELAQPRPEAAWVAALEAQGAPVRFLAVYDPSGGLRIHASAGEQAAGGALQLWLIEPGQSPLSLGVLADAGATVLAVEPGLAAGIGEASTLAVSVEPAGGSPTGQPTGPVIASGQPKAL